LYTSRSMLNQTSNMLSFFYGDIKGHIGRSADFSFLLRSILRVQIMLKDGRKWTIIDSHSTIYFTASTAAKYIGLSYSTLKDDLSRYNKFESQIKRGLVKKEGRVWLITKQALHEVYEKPRF